MSVYYCQECDNYKDGDWEPCVEHNDECICEECAANIEEEPEKVSPRRVIASKDNPSVSYTEKK